MAVPDALPSNVRDLLEERIDSFEKLELVLVLRVAKAATMTMDELLDTLHHSRDMLRAMVAELTAAKLVERTPRGAVQLATARSPDGATLAQLAELWESERVLVSRTLADNAVARIRRMAERALAGRRRGGNE